MSHRDRTTHIAAAALGIIVAGALAAVAALGFTGWPPARAYAATGGATFGVVAETAVEIGPEVDAGAKLPAANASTPKTRAAANRLAKPAAKARPRVPVARPVARPAPAPRPVVSSKPRVRRVARAPRARVSTAGWRIARVSWYGPGFYGNGMAGGGTLQPDSMVVAHRTLAFGTKVRFSYKGRVVTATVMDRGPHVSGREFDLGPGTAKALGFSGVSSVRYLVLGK